ncbi:MAG: TonB-dependent receptor plug domain-containing protein [Rikenellaceae bacterium]
MMKKTHSKRSVACFKRWNKKSYAAFASMHKQVKIGVLSVGMSILSLAATEAMAADVDTLKIFKVVDIDDVGVTLEKESPTRSAMAPTQLFSRATQAAAPLQTLESALRLSPSIDVRERGGKGIQTDLSIRGGSFDQTMVLLNGINFTDARTGHQTHSLPIDIESVAGIDLIDGVSGVGAYAGAINFRTAPLEPTYGRLELVGGQHGYGYANLSGAYSSDRLTLYGVGSWRKSDGYRDNTDFENINGYIRATYDSAKAGFFDMQVGAQQREFGANGFYSLSYPNQREATETYLGSLRWFKSFNNLTLNSSVSYRKNYDCFELIAGSPDIVPYNYHMTNNVGAELWADYSWAAGKTTLGGDYTYNQIYSTVLGDSLDEAVGRYTKGADRSVANIYLRHIRQWDKFGVASSIGMSSTPYGNSPLWSVSGSYRPVESLFFELGATGTMRLPTFTDLYYTATGYISDETLQPEEATTYRLSGQYRRSMWELSAQVYIRQGHNVIDWVKESADASWQSMQITELSTLGTEMAASYAPQGFVERIRASYGYITMDKDSGAMISKYATDYMRHKASADIILNLPLNLSLAITASGYAREGNYTSAEGTVEEYKPYFLLDGRLSWECKKIRIYLDATNITSTEYFDYGGLIMPEAWLTLGASFTF